MGSPAAGRRWGARRVRQARDRNFPPSAPPWPSSSASSDLSRSSTGIASWPARSWSDGAGWKESTRPEVEQNKMLLNGAVPQEPYHDASVIQGFLDNFPECLAAGADASQAKHPLLEFEDGFTQGAAPASIGPTSSTSPQSCSQ